MRLVAGVVIVLHLREALAGRIVDQRVEDHRHARQVVEQRVEVVVEERQPVLHAGIAPALADRLVEPVVAGRRAEGRHIGLPEAPDALGGELDLAHRHEIEGAQRADRALGLRIEGADRFERVAEEVEADRVGQARRERDR